MSFLALLFLGAGLAAAGLSGFANYQAFSGLVTDPMQARVWGWAGVIASVCSFGGFTFFWWHSTHGRWREAIRTVLFALAGAGASFAGTALFMEQQSAERGQMASQVAVEREVVESQIADWSAQLQGIPADIRSVEGLEAYIAEVERVGRTHQKPYRDAMNELGLARRRAALEADIDAARDRLVALGGAQGAVAQVQTVPSWGFALLLELFSSQATSIACVSLLLLFGARTQARQKRPGPD